MRSSLLCYALLLALGLATAACVASASPLTHRFTAAAASRGVAVAATANPAGASAAAQPLSSLPQSVLVRALHRLSSAAQTSNGINTANAFDAIVHESEHTQRNTARHGTADTGAL